MSTPYANYKNPFTYSSGYVAGISKESVNKIFKLYSSDDMFVCYSVSRDAYINTENDCGPLTTSKDRLAEWLVLMSYEYLKDVVVFKVIDEEPDTSIEILNGRDLYDSAFLNTVVISN